MWVKPTLPSYPNWGFQTLADFGNANPRTDRVVVGLSTSSLRPYLQVYQGSSYGLIYGSDNLTPQTWNHVVIVWDSGSGQATFYVNTVHTAAAQTIQAPLNVTRSANFIASATGGVQPLVASASEVAIYASALPSGTISNHYTSGTTGTSGYPSMVQAASPVAYWRLNDLPTSLTLSSVASSSGTSAVYTGTITGGGSNAFVDKGFTVSGFSTPSNNGLFTCLASTASTVTLVNSAAVAEAAAATATYPNVAADSAGSHAGTYSGPVVLNSVAGINGYTTGSGKTAQFGGDTLYSYALWETDWSGGVTNVSPFAYVSNFATLNASSYNMVHPAAGAPGIHTYTITRGGNTNCLAQGWVQSRFPLNDTGLPTSTCNPVAPARNSTGDVSVQGILTATLTGNASTATALAANPVDCAANTFANAIAANGDLTCSTVPNAATTAVSTNTPNALVLRDASGNFSAGTVTATLTGNASTASTLATTPAQCTGGQFATGVAASGNANCSSLSGVGTVTASGTPAQYDIAYWTSALNLTKVTAPTTKGSYTFGYNLTADAAAAPTLSLAGVTNRSVTGTTSTDTILYNDQRVDYVGSVPVGVTLPTSATLGNPHFAVRLSNNTTGSATAVTMTPTSWQISGASNLVIAQGESCLVTVDAGGSAWDADCQSPALAAGTGVSFARSAYGLSLAVMSYGDLLTSHTPATGLARTTSGGQTVASSELSGDAATSGSNVVSVLKVNGQTPGGTCTNQFVRVIDSSGRPSTCASVQAADIANNVITGTQLASSLALVTPNIGAATATSLLATGIVDGAAPVTTTTTCTTGAHCTLGGTYKSGYTLNQHATASTATFYDLPTVASTVAGMQYCVYNDAVGGTGAAETGVITITPSASVQISQKGTVGTAAHTATSGGAAGDGACFVAITTTLWKLFPQSGTWTLTP